MELQKKEAAELERQAQIDAEIEAMLNEQQSYAEFEDIHEYRNVGLPPLDNIKVDPASKTSLRQDVSYDNLSCDGCGVNL